VLKSFDGRRLEHADDFTAVSAKLTIATGERWIAKVKVCKLHVWDIEVM